MKNLFFGILMMLSMPSITPTFAGDALLGAEAERRKAMMGGLSNFSQTTTTFGMTTTTGATTTIRITMPTTTTTTTAKSCFLAGTSIEMENGSPKNIEDIVPGDRVRSAHGKVNTVKFDPKASNEETQGLDVTALTDKDWLMTANDKKARLASFKHQHMKTTVYNLILTDEGDHTYRANGFHVHNKLQPLTCDGVAGDGYTLESCMSSCTTSQTCTFVASRCGCTKSASTNTGSPTTGGGGTPPGVRPQYN